MWFLRPHGGFVPRKRFLAAVGLTASRMLPLWGTTTVLGGGLQHYQNNALELEECRSRLRTARLFSTTLRGGGSTTNDHHTKTYILGIGSNLGDRYENIRQALELLASSHCSGLRTSFLYETPPMYMTEQPAFLNAVVRLASDLEPLELLRRLKEIERDLGRDMSDGAIRNGPRPVDLDILCGTTTATTGPTTSLHQLIHESETLTIPHPRMMERAFVLLPLLDVLRNDDPSTRFALESLSDRSSIVRVLPLPRNRLLYWNETLVMGVLNVTPDSFSDGVVERSVDASVQACLAMEQEGAHIVDIGGESTRPGAKEVEVQEELRRTIPVIQAVRKASDIPISIDTRHAAVAKAAVAAGADMVNDVSGGMFDPDMLPTVGALGVPMILMHMRGTPETMQSMTGYDSGVVEEVTRCLARQSNLAAVQHGIYQWLQILDPGIGFAKDMEGNLELLRHLGGIRKECANVPLLLGTSRKGFLGKLTGVEVPNQRDPATMASCVAALALAGPGPAMLRVHNVADCRQATQVLDAILQSSVSHDKTC